MAVIGRLTRVSNAIDRRLANSFAKSGIDGASFDVLATLLRSGAPHSLSPAALADAAMVTSSAIAQRLNKLSAEGLVVRTRDATDGRSIRVGLTEKGRELVEAAVPRHLATEAELLEGIEPADRLTLIRLLQTIDRNASPSSLK